VGDWLRVRKNATKAEIDKRVADVYDCVYDEHKSDVKARKEEAAERAREAAERVRVMLEKDLNAKT
jgi:hypothetical protein